jgi:hypothetical protein
MKIIASNLNSYKLYARKLRRIFTYEIDHFDEINYLNIENELFLLSHTPDHGQCGEIILYEAALGKVLFQFNDELFSPILLHKISNEQVLIISNSHVFGHGEFEDVYVLIISSMELQELNEVAEEDHTSFKSSFSLFPYPNSEYRIDLERLQYQVL